MRVRAAVAGVVASLLLTACDPASVPSQPDRAYISVDVVGAGRAEVRGILGGHLDGAVIDVVGERLAQVLFPGRDVRVEVNGNDGGYPYLFMIAFDAYTPGLRVVVEIDVGPAIEALRDVGFTDGSFTLCFPEVDIEVTKGTVGPSGCAEWPLERPPIAAQIEVVMRPRPSVWLPEAALALVSAVAAVVAVFGLRRRRWSMRWMVASAGAGLAGATCLVAFGTSEGGDALGVAGVVSGRLLDVASVAPGLMVFFGGFGCAGMAIVATGRIVRLHRFPSRPDR
jgi:hypothetical protein